MKEVSKFFTLNNYICRMLSVSRTLDTYWEKITSEKRDKLVAVMKEGSAYCIMMQKENDIKEIIPEHLVKGLEEDNNEIFELIKFCLESEFQPLKLSNQQKMNPHGEKVIKAIMATCEENSYAPLEDFIRMWR